MNIHQHIIESIKEQLFFNDYLVIPDFGGFVLKKQASTFATSGTNLLPPTKTIGFNVLLKQNDGILTNSLQDKLGCSNQEAKQHLYDFAIFCSSILNTKRRLSLISIGVFYLDFENSTCFEPEINANFFTDSFGLEPISLLPLEHEKKEDTPPTLTFKPQDRILSSSSDQSPKKLIKKNYTNVLLVGILTILLGTFLVFLASNLQVKGHLYSALWSTSKNSNYTPLSYPVLQTKLNFTSNNNFVADVDGIALFKLNEEKSIAVKVLDNNLVLNTNNSKSYCKYEIILGCFKVMKNAKRMLKQLNKDNIKASIKVNSYKGMHVVSVNGINDKIEAIESLEQIQSIYPKAWMKVN